MVGREEPAHHSLGGRGRGRPNGLVDSSRWQRRAACRESPLALFFPPGNSRLTRFDEERAKAVCSSCPVRNQCLSFAMEHEEPFGVWGGLNAEERRALKSASMNDRRHRTDMNGGSDIRRWARRARSAHDGVDGQADEVGAHRGEGADAELSRAGAEHGPVGEQADHGADQ
jgi:WhiB family redox-sensing transcriptional regulator